MGYSPWGCKESDMTEQLHFHFLLVMIESRMPPRNGFCLFHSPFFSVGFISRCQPLSATLAAPGLLTTNPVNSVEKLILYFVPSEIPLPKVLELAIKSII